MRLMVVAAVVLLAGEGVAERRVLERPVTTASLQRAVDGVSSAGGGTVVVPNGEWTIGTVWLKSGVELHLSDGAVLKGSGNLADYNAEDAYPQNFSSKNEGWSGKHLLIAHEVHDVALTGRGAIDGNAGAFMAELDPAKPTGDFVWRHGHVNARDRAHRGRPGQELAFIESQGIRISGVTLRNMAMWTCFLHGCEDVRIEGVTVSNALWHANTDGFDIDSCRRVTVSGCTVFTGDDAFAIRGTVSRLKDRTKVCEDVLVTNCTCTSAASGVRIGVGEGAIRRVRFSDVRIREAGHGLLVQSCYPNAKYTGVAISDVIFENVTIGDSAHAIIVTAGTDKADTTLRDIVFRNVTATTSGSVIVEGAGKTRPRGIVFDGLDLHLVPPARPRRDKKDWEVVGAANRLLSAVSVEKADDVSIVGLRVTREASLGDERRLDVWDFDKSDPNRDEAIAVACGARAGEFPLTDWEFSRDGEAWTRVEVPHDWAIAGPFDLAHDRQTVRIVENGEEKATDKVGRTGSLPWIGKGVYRRRVEVPKGAEWAALVFDGAMSEPEVLLDGRRIGGWKYGYTPFEVELPTTGGEVTVTLDNPPLSSRWYPGAGLYRPVALRWGGRIGLKTWGVDIVTPDLETVDVAVELRNPDGVPTEVRHRILDAGGHCVAEGASPLKVKGARAWSPEDPYLYTLETEVRAGGRTADLVRRKFGIRTLEYGQGFFKLNGRTRKFRGVCLHHDLGPLGAAFSKDAFRRQVRLLKEMGCDSIRTAHNIPAPGQLEVCDEEGMMVVAESFDSWAEPKVKNGYNRFFAEWWKRDLRRLVECGRGHPSVVMWSVGNEISEQRHAKGAALYAEMQAFVRSRDRDASRPVSAGASSMPAAIKSGFVAAMDIPAVTYRLPFYEAMHAVSPRQGSVLGIETASTVSSRGTYHFPVAVTNRPYHADGQCSGYDTEFCTWSNLPDDDWAKQDDLTWTIGEFVWTGFDYLGEPTPYDDATPSHSSYFGIFDLAGLPKDRYWLYRSRWRTDAHTLHLVPHWTFPGREGLVTPVYCYTDFDEAELFLNDRSLGRRKKDPSSRLDRYRLRWNDVVYEPGELKVVAYGRDGRPALTNLVRTAGTVHALKTEKRRFGKLLFVTVSAVDANGTLVPSAADKVRATVGAGLRFRGMASGDATSLESFAIPEMRLFRGQLVAVFEGEGDSVSFAICR